MKTEKKEVFGWKDCLVLTGGKTEVIVTTAFGPRIVSLRYDGGENHFAVFEETKGKVAKNTFTHYGGHRLWHAPETKGRTDLPDNRPCRYEIGEGSVLVCAEADASGIEKGLEISIADDGEVTVEHILRNTNLFDVELSIWGITQFAPCGVMAVPVSSLDTGLVANRAVSLWPYSKMTDPRVYWGEKFITVKPDKTMPAPFKVGTSCDDGYAVYFNHGQMFAKRFAYYFGAEYPNYYCNFESYTCDTFIEIETLSPLLTLEAGDEERHTEKWRVYTGVDCPAATDETAIQAAVRLLQK